MFEQAEIGHRELYDVHLMVSGGGGNGGKEASGTLPCLMFFGTGGSINEAVPHYYCR